MSFTRSLFLLPALALFFSFCRSTDDEPKFATLLIRLQHVAGKKNLVADQLIFKDSANQEYTVSRFNYYLSNIKLRNRQTGDFFFEVDSYHLINALINPQNKEIILKNVPKKRYSELEISIGVDNAANHSTDKRGQLDPGNGMAWDWNIGYKFFELEGKYKDASGAEKPYLFHVGEDPNFRTLTFSFNQLLGSEFDVVKDGQIILEANVEAAFGQPNPVNFNLFNNAMSIASGTNKIAENYTEGFLRMIGAQ